MGTIRPFQIALLGGSVFLFFAAIVFISIYEQPAPEGEQFEGSVVIWGTIDESVMNEQVSEIERTDDRFKRVSYQAFREEEFLSAFVNALAEQRGPDLIVLPHTQLVELRSKLYAIAKDHYGERRYRDTFVEGAEIFLMSDGIYALPFAVDPLVMYWNRDTFSTNNIAQQPTTWEQVRNDTVPRLTRLGGTYDIVQSAIAFGEFRNVRNAGPVLSMLMLQSGSSVVTELGNSYQINFGSSFERGNSAATLSPGIAAVTFYTSFANPATSLYTWNRSLPEDRQRFLGGDLALYFGFGSEFSELERANPNLNFDMAEVPQGQGATIRRTYGEFYGFAIPLAAANKDASYRVAEALTTAANSKRIAEGLSMSSPHRSVISAGTSNPYQEVRNRASLVARGWLTSSESAMNSTFASMIEDVTSGRTSVSQAVSNAAERLRLTF